MAAVTVTGEVATKGVKENQFWGGQLAATEDYPTNGTKYSNLNEHTVVIKHVTIAADGDTHTDANLAGRIDSVAFQPEDLNVAKGANPFVSNRGSGIITFDTNTATAVTGWVWMLVYNGDNMGRKVGP